MYYVFVLFVFYNDIQAGIGELWRTFNLNAQVKDLQRFVPELKRSDVMRGPAGVRAQVNLTKILSRIISVA